MVASLSMLRHGRTPFAGRLIGATDVELSPEGIEQIRTIRDSLHKNPYKRIFCSPMRRCRQTAEILAVDARTSFVEDLREVDFGRWEALQFSEIEKQDPDLVNSWVKDPEGFCFPEGESLAVFIARIENFRRMLIGLDSENVLVISHGGVIRQLICSYLGLSPTHYLLFEVRAGKLATLDCFGDKGVLTGLNRGEGR